MRTAVDQAGQFIPNEQNGPVLSPDDTRFAASVVEPTGNHIWVYELAGARTVSKLTTRGSSNRRPAWAPDGRSLLFITGRDSAGPVPRVMPADGSAAPVPVEVLKDARTIQEALWSHDGTWIVYRASGRGRGIFGIRPAVDSAPRTLIDTEFNESAPALSPNDRMIAYVSDRSGQFEVYLRPFPDGDAWRVQISSGGGVEPVWSHTGRELFYKSPAQRALVAASIVEGVPPKVENRTVLFRLPDDARYYEFHALYDVSRDDRRFLMFVSPEARTGSNGDLILAENFFHDVQATLAPGNGR